MKTVNHFTCSASIPQCPVFQSGLLCPFCAHTVCASFSEMPDAVCMNGFLKAEAEY